MIGDCFTKQSRHSAPRCGICPAQGFKLWKARLPAKGLWVLMQRGLILNLVTFFTFRHWGRNDVSSGFFAQIQRHSAFIAESVLLSGCVWGKVRCHALFLLWVNCVLEPIQLLVARSPSGTEAGMTLGVNLLPCKTSPGIKFLPVLFAIFRGSPNSKPINRFASTHYHSGCPRA